MLICMDMSTGERVAAPASSDEPALRFDIRELPALELGLQCVLSEILQAPTVRIADVEACLTRMAQEGV